MPYAALPVALAQTAVLILARTGSLFLLSPGFSQRQIPVAVRTAITFSFASLIFLTIPSLKHPLETAPLLIAIVAQIALGFLQGLLFNLAMEAIAAAGDLLDMQVGYAFASLVDPTRDSSPHALLSRLHNLAALALFFGMGGHLWVLAAMLHSVQVAPLESAAIHSQLVDGILLQAGGMLRSSLQMAAPVIAYLALVDIVIMVLSKSVPQLQIMSVAFPVKIIIGLLAVSSFLPGLVGSIVRLLEGVYRLMAGG